MTRIAPYDRSIFNEMESIVETGLVAFCLHFLGSDDHYPVVGTSDHRSVARDRCKCKRRFSSPCNRDIDKYWHWPSANYDHGCGGPVRILDADARQLRGALCS